MKSIWTHRRLRLLLASVATIVTGAALASAALAGIRALDLGPAAASQYPKKVTVCHKTHSKKHPWVKIRISRNALKAHLRHGDFVVDETHPLCPPPPTAASAKGKHHGKGKHHQNGVKGKGKHHQNAAKGKGKHHQNAAKAKHHGSNKGHGKK
jgi:hypothetical protein